MVTLEKTYRPLDMMTDSEVLAAGSAWMDECLTQLRAGDDEGIRQAKGSFLVYWHEVIRRGL